MKTKLKYTLLLLFAVSLHSCSTNEKELDTPTAGNITISVDESISRVIDSEVFTFQGIYPSARIVTKYKPEAEIFDDLLMDSARLIVSARKLTSDEMKYFEKIEIIPSETKICLDAIAVILNKENTDTLLSLETLKLILSGKISSWKQINNNSRLSEIQVIYDNPQSSTVRIIQEIVGVNLSQNSYAVKTNPEVINYVSKNKNALGLIGVNWISDRDDYSTNKFLQSVRVLGLKSNTPNVNPTEYYQPFQAYIALKTYPLIREFYLISREARTGLGSGLAAFIAGEKGQRIFLKAGLVPATMPIRLIETYQ